MQYQTPGRRRIAGGKSRSPQLTEPHAVSDFCQCIESTPAEDWLKRVQALESLVAAIPDGSAYLQSSPNACWYNAPTILSHLARPLQELLRDPRSTVVRRVCAALTTLFHKCQSDARLLLKDLMPTVLHVQAQTVQVIRSAVRALIQEAIPEVPCKSVMPLWMERLKQDKSPAVRDACALYLGLALQHWSSEAGYLTDDIFYQVGHVLLKTLRDPSPTVRQHTKAALIHMVHHHPTHYERLLSDDGVVRDVKLQHWLRTLGSAAPPDDLSVASKWTYHSESRWATTKAAVHQNATRISSPRMLLLDDDDDAALVEKVTVPFSIAVTVDRPRTATSAALVGTPPRVPAKTMNTTHVPPTPQSQTYSALALQAASQEEEEAFEYSASDPAAAMVETAEEISPFIASMHELKKHASRRRSRNSLLMVERFKNSSSSVAAATRVEPTATPAAPEHIVLAIRLLRAHKAHVDQIMETLKLEMDTLRDFDRLLEEPGRPTQDELLQYYESMDLCLRQRGLANATLRREMDRISAGEEGETQ